MNDLTRLSTEDLAALYRKNRRNRDTVLQILAELERREAKRKANGQPLVVAATELKETISRHLGIAAEQAAQASVIASTRASKPWYRRGILFSLVGLAAVGIVQGIFHAIGFHMWEPILVAIRNAGKQWGLN